MARLKLDLNDIPQKDRLIETELNRSIEMAIEKRVSFLEIVFGENNAELKKRILRFLDQPKLKELYHRVEKDEKQFGRVFIHFKILSKRKKIGLSGHPGLIKTL